MKIRRYERIDRRNKYVYSAKIRNFYTSVLGYHPEIIAVFGNPCARDRGKHLTTLFCESCKVGISGCLICFIQKRKLRLREVWEARKWWGWDQG